MEQARLLANKWFLDNGTPKANDGTIPELLKYIQDYFSARKMKEPSPSRLRELIPQWASVHDHDKAEKPEVKAAN